VVELELAGCCIVLWSLVVVVVLCGPGSFTVVQADSDTKTAAAMHGMTIVFIIGIILWICYLLVVVVVVVFVSSTTGVAGTSATTFLTMTFEATIWSPSLT